MIKINRSDLDETKNQKERSQKRHKNQRLNCSHPQKSDKNTKLEAKIYTYTEELVHNHVGPVHTASV